MPRIVRALGLVALLGTVATCAGTSDSLLENGETVSTGKKRYDDFFDRIAQLRDDVEGFDADLFPVREPLTDQLELDVEISMADLLTKVRKRAVKFRDYGVTLSLRLTPDAKLLTVRGKLDVDTKDEQTLGAIEESASRALKTFHEYTKLLGKTAELEAEREALSERLAKVDHADPEAGRIETELEGAGRLLEDAQDKLLRDTRTLALYLISLADAVDTGAAEAKDKECEDALAGRTKKPSKPRGPRRPPPPRPPSGDEFEM